MSDRDVLKNSNGNSLNQDSYKQSDGVSSSSSEGVSRLLEREIPGSSKHGFSIKVADNTFMTSNAHLNNRNTLNISQQCVSRNVVHRASGIGSNVIQSTGSTTSKSAADIARSSPSVYHLLVESVGIKRLPSGALNTGPVLSEPVGLKCPDCGIPFEREYTLNVHQKQAHAKQNVQMETQLEKKSTKKNAQPKRQVTLRKAHLDNVAMQKPESLSVSRPIILIQSAHDIISKDDVLTGRKLVETSSLQMIDKRETPLERLHTKQVNLHHCPQPHCGLGFETPSALREHLPVHMPVTKNNPCLNEGCTEDFLSYQDMHAHSKVCDHRPLGKRPVMKPSRNVRRNARQTYSKGNSSITDGRKRSSTPNEFVTQRNALDTFKDGLPRISDDRATVISEDSCPKSGQAPNISPMVIPTKGNATVLFTQDASKRLSSSLSNVSSGEVSDLHKVSKSSQSFRDKIKTNTYQIPKPISQSDNIHLEEPERLSATHPIIFTQSAHQKSSKDSLRKRSLDNKSPSKINEKQKASSEDFPSVESEAYNCPVPSCGKRFETLAVFNQHLLVHLSNTRIYPCLEEGCKEEFQIKQEVQEHMKLCHTPKSATTEASLPIIRDRDVSKTSGRSSQTIVSDVKKSRKLDTVASKTVHFKKKYLPECPDKDDTEDNDEQQISKHKKWKHRMIARQEQECQKNSERVNSKPELHQKAGKELTTFRCELCGKNFPALPQLKTHKESDHSITTAASSTGRAEKSSSDRSDVRKKSYSVPNQHHDVIVDNVKIRMKCPKKTKVPLAILKNFMRRLKVKYLKSNEAKDEMASDKTRKRPSSETDVGSSERKRQIMQKTVDQANSKAQNDNSTNEEHTITTKTKVRSKSGKMQTKKVSYRLKYKILSLDKLFKVDEKSPKENDVNMHVELDVDSVKDVDDKNGKETERESVHANHSRSSSTSTQEENRGVQLTSESSDNTQPIASGYPRPDDGTNGSHTKRSHSNYAVPKEYTSIIKPCFVKLKDIRIHPKDIQTSNLTSFKQSQSSQTCLDRSQNALHKNILANGNGQKIQNPKRHIQNRGSGILKSKDKKRNKANCINYRSMQSWYRRIILESKKDAGHTHKRGKRYIRSTLSASTTVADQTKITSERIQLKKNPKDKIPDAEESETPSVQQASNPSPCPRTPSPCYDSINPSPLRSTFPEVCKSQKYDRLEKRRTSDESETRQLLGASVHGSSSVEEVVSGSTESTSSFGSVCETTCPETVEVAQSSSKQGNDTIKEKNMQSVVVKLERLPILCGSSDKTIVLNQQTERLLNLPLNWRIGSRSPANRTHQSISSTVDTNENNADNNDKVPDKCGEIQKHIPMDIETGVDNEMDTFPLPGAPLAEPNLSRPRISSHDKDPDDHTFHVEENPLRNKGTGLNKSGLNVLTPTVRRNAKRKCAMKNIMNEGNLDSKENLLNGKYASIFDEHSFSIQSVLDNTTFIIDSDTSSNKSSMCGDEESELSRTCTEQKSAMYESRSKQNSQADKQKQTYKSNDSSKMSSKEAYAMNENSVLAQQESAKPKKRGRPPKNAHPDMKHPEKPQEKVKALQKTTRVEKLETVLARIAKFGDIEELSPPKQRLRRANITNSMKSPVKKENIEKEHLSAVKQIFANAADKGNFLEIPVVGPDAHERAEESNANSNEQEVDMPVASEESERNLESRGASKSEQDIDRGMEITEQSALSDEETLVDNSKSQDNTSNPDVCVDSNEFESIPALNTENQTCSNICSSLEMCGTIEDPLKNTFPDNAKNTEVVPLSVSVETNTSSSLTVENSHIVPHISSPNEKNVSDLSNWNTKENVSHQIKNVSSNQEIQVDCVDSSTSSALQLPTLSTPVSRESTCEEEFASGTSKVCGHDKKKHSKQRKGTPVRSAKSAMTPVVRREMMKAMFINGDQSQSPIKEETVQQPSSAVSERSTALSEDVTNQVHEEPTPNRTEEFEVHASEDNDVVKKHSCCSCICKCGSTSDNSQQHMPESQDVVDLTLEDDSDEDDDVICIDSDQDVFCTGISRQNPSSSTNGHDGTQLTCKSSPRISSWNELDQTLEKCMTRIRSNFPAVKSSGETSGMTSEELEALITSDNDFIVTLDSI